MLGVNCSAVLSRVFVVAAIVIVIDGTLLLVRFRLLAVTAQNSTQALALSEITCLLHDGLHLFQFRHAAFSKRLKIW